MDIRDRFSESGSQGGFSRDMKLSAFVILIVVGAVLFLTFSSPEPTDVKKIASKGENLFDEKDEISERVGKLLGGNRQNRTREIEVAEVGSEKPEPRGERPPTAGGTSRVGPSININDHNAPVSKDTVHIVSRGDSLSRIAARYYGDETKWRKVMRDNGMNEEQAGRLHVGQRLVIKDAGRTPADRTGGVGFASAENNRTSEPDIRINIKKDHNVTGTYIVQPGDTLINIAELVYGDRNMWRQLEEINGIKAKDLKYGQVIKY